MFVRILKTILMFVLAMGFSIALYFLCRPFIQIWYDDYVGIYGEFTWLRLTEVGFDSILNTEYAKYVYFTLCCWLIAISTTVVSIIKFVRRLWCVTQRDCLECVNYIKCRDKVVRERRKY